MVYKKKTTTTKKFLPNSSSRTILRTAETLCVNMQLNFNSPGRDNREGLQKEEDS